MTATGYPRNTDGSGWADSSGLGLINKLKRSAAIDARERKSEYGARGGGNRVYKRSEQEK